jgi:hypothetical protein
VIVVSSLRLSLHLSFRLHIVMKGYDRWMDSLITKLVTHRNRLILVDTV